MSEANVISGMPNEIEPSDHLMISATFDFQMAEGGVTNSV